MQTTKPIALETPIKRGDQVITAVTLRRPDAGTLRGTTLIDLMQMDVSALTIVLPRIAMPQITQQDVRQMDPADLNALGQEVAGFLLKKADLARAKTEIGETTTDSSAGPNSETPPSA